MPAFFRSTLLALAAVAALSACGSISPPPTMAVDNARLPEAVRVPASEARFRSTSTGIGEITYGCRDKKDAAGQFESAFVAPQAACDSANRGARQQVAYRADYVCYGR